MEQHYPFYLPKLSYEYSSLEPYIDTETMIVHYNGHLKTYIDNLNSTLKNYPKYHKLNLTELIKLSRYFPMENQNNLINNAGGVYNHFMYFDLLKRSDISNMPDKLKKYIEENFICIDNFIKKITECALKVFGSGYTFLVVDKYKKMKLINTKNQDTPLNMGLYPILLIDVWEHAYYLKHKNKRVDYINDFIKVIDWEKVNKNLEKCFYL